MAVESLIPAGLGDVVAASLEFGGAADGTGQIGPREEPTIRMVNNKGSKSLIGLLKDEDVLPAVVGHVAEGLLIPRDGLDPDRAFDRVLLMREAEEVLDGDEAVVAELQSVLGGAPAVNVGKAGREDRETVVEQPGVQERDVEVGPEPGQPAIALQQDLREGFHHLAVVGRVLLIQGEIGDRDDVRLALTNDFPTRAEDDTVVSVEVGSLQIPCNDTQGGTPLRVG